MRVALALTSQGLPPRNSARYYLVRPSAKTKGTTIVVPAFADSSSRLYSIIPARASSDFTAILCSTLKL